MVQNRAEKKERVCAHLCGMPLTLKLKTSLPFFCVFKKKKKTFHIDGVDTNTFKIRAKGQNLAVTLKKTHLTSDVLPGKNQTHSRKNKLGSGIRWAEQCNLLVYQSSA